MCSNERILQRTRICLCIFSYLCQNHWTFEASRSPGIRMKLKFHLDSRSGEVGDFEFDFYRRFSFSLFAHYGRQREMSAQQIFLATCKITSFQRNSSGKVPGKLLMDQTNALCSGVYFTDPMLVWKKNTNERFKKIPRTLNLGESASDGTGMMISTLFAVERLLNWDLACKFTVLFFQRWKFNLDHELDSGMTVPLHIRFDPDQRLHDRGQPENCEFTWGLQIH